MIRIAGAVSLATALLLGSVFAQESPVVRQENNSSGSAQPGAATADPAEMPFQQRYPRYQIRKSDVIELKFKLSPEFDQTVTVQPDGYISLEGAGDVQVENKTVPELTEAVRAAYKGILHEPIISVSLKDFDKPFFIVAGQVGHPGKFDLRSDTTLVEALAIAGDVTTSAKHSQVVLFHHVSNEMVEARVFDVKRMLGSRNLQEDPHLLPGDMVFVPQNKISKLQRFLPTASMGAFLSPTQF
jgi:polysaccharide export outer membrane protein